MPPKAKITKEAIIDKAFELTRLYGFDQITARGLATELSCSTQPIFHIFENMEELKKEVYLKTRTFFETKMLTPSDSPDVPLFLSMGLNYVVLAQNEKNLFRLLCMSNSFELHSIYDLAKNVPLPIDPEMFLKMWIFTHGIASIVSTNTAPIPIEEIKQLLMKAGTDFYNGSAVHKKNNGDTGEDI